jgi:hypothetical protein
MILARLVSPMIMTMARAMKMKMRRRMIWMEIVTELEPGA